MKIGEFFESSVKNAFGSAQNFMTPGVGTVYVGKGVAPLSPAPGFGNVNPKLEGGLAASASESLGVNLGNITADSYSGSSPGLAGLSGYDEDDKKAANTGLKLVQENADNSLNLATAGAHNYMLKAQENGRR